ncbi:MAG: Asp-tRNA(Asn)/Glu-tRNA(Gln) amidotransferase subunit GatC [bacterium]
MKKASDIITVVEKTTSLARLRFEPSEFGRFAEKVEAVLSYVAQLNELGTSGIEPTSHAVEVGSALREDKAIRSGIDEKILSAAPARDGPYVQVPKVIDSE